jgi:uncharacterized Ntn-hydrolase superfamily protein
VVTWARAGVGAVATQSVARTEYGPEALDALAAGGRGAQAVLEELLAADPLARLRQVAVADADGGVAVHTGADCIPFAGHVIGGHFSCQANMMAREGVPEAMAEAFEAAGEDALPERLLAALQGAERAGGDVRGRQSSALLVVPATGEPWQRRLELRVEDHEDPVGELGRLLVLARAYELAGQADELAGQGRGEEAGRRYQQAAELAPASDELAFWAGMGRAAGGDVAGGAEIVRRAAAVHPGWLDLLDRLPPELGPAAVAVRRELGR